MVIPCMTKASDIQSVLSFITICFLSTENVLQNLLYNSCCKRRTMCHNASRYEESSSLLQIARENI